MHLFLKLINWKKKSKLLKFQLVIGYANRYLQIGTNKNTTFILLFIIKIWICGLFRDYILNLMCIFLKIYFTAWQRRLYPNAACHTYFLKGGRARVWVSFVPSLTERQTSQWFTDALVDIKSTWNLYVLNSNSNTAGNSAHSQGTEDEHQ